MATETQLTLSNTALAAAGGRSTIEQLDENSNEARQASLVFSKTVRAVLALVPWDFSTTTAEPASVTPATVIPPGWRFVYERPSSALVIQQVFDGGGGAQAGIPIFPGGIGQTFVAGGKTQYATGWLGGIRVLFTNSAKPTMQYTWWNTDFDTWSPMAIEVLVATLAAKLAMPISGDKTLRDRLKQEQMQLEVRAKTIAANETVDVQDYPAEWLLARELGEWSFAPASDASSPNAGALPPGLIASGGVGLPNSPPAGPGLFWNDGGLLAITGA